MRSTTTYNLGLLKLTAVYFRVLCMGKFVSSFVFCIQHTVLSKFDYLIGLLFRENQQGILSLKFLRSQIVLCDLLFKLPLALFYLFSTTIYALISLAHYSVVTSIFLDWTERMLGRGEFSWTALNLSYGIHFEGFLPPNLHCKHQTFRKLTSFICTKSMY